jgi:hypothetical protein
LINWKDNFKEGKELVLSTCSADGTPHANIVVSLGFADNKILVADCQMKTTFENMSRTKKACLIGSHIRIKGAVQIFSSEKYFDACVKKSKGYAVNHAILVCVDDVFDLDNVKRIV